MKELQIQLGVEDIKNAIDRSLKSKIKKSEIVAPNVINIVPVSKTNLMFDLKTLRVKLADVIIGGIPTIARALISKENAERHIIYAEGLGLRRVLGTAGVDYRRSYSNHITEVEECLGVEAARQSIINQITETMREHGVNVNPRHINLLSEVMTCKGRIVGFTRNDVDKSKDSTIMLASFEKTTDFLFDAATQGKHDRMRGVSEKIIMGQPITIGTGMFDLRHDVKKPLIYGKPDKRKKL